MTKKSDEPIEIKSWSTYKRQARILAEETIARKYDSESALVRDIFDAWIDENHNAKASSPSGVSEK